MGSNSIKERTNSTIYIRAFYWSIKCLIKSCPLVALLRIITDIVIALMPSVTILIMANIVDNALKAYLGDNNALLRYVIIYVLTITLKQFLISLIPAMNIYMQRALKTNYNKEVFVKYNKIDCETLESEEFNNL